jgi:predicted RecA/RadA family phage recombinase
MKNFVQNGDVLTVTAHYDVASGAGLLVGSLFAVATAAALNGATIEAQITGVVELAKVSAQAWTVGALIYWDNAAKLTTTVSTSNKLIGTAVAAAENPSSTGRVRLNAAFIS